MEYYKSSIRDVKPQEVPIDGSRGATVQWLVTNEHGANYAARKFTVEPSGLIPMHFHEYQETMIITKGSCTLCVGDKTIDLKEGDFIFINKNVKHALINKNDTLEFFCMIDYPKDMSVKLLQEKCNG